MPPISKPQFGPAIASQLAGEMETEGGFTYNTKTGKRPRKGWAVSEAGAEQTHTSPTTPETIGHYATTMEARLSQPGRHLGGWVDAGRGYLDTTRIFREGDQAGATWAMVDNDQMAMYNLRTGMTVRNPLTPAMGGAPAVVPATKHQRRRGRSRSL